MADRAPPLPASSARMSSPVVLHAAWDWNPLGGLGGFFWLLAVGAISIAVLRGRVRESIRQERLFAASPQFSAS